MDDMLFGNLSHLSLLKILPFECGYLCQEDGNPDAYSVSIAMILQSVSLLMRPAAYQQRELRN